MAFPTIRMADMGATEQFLTFLLGSAIFCLSVRSIYRLYFRPLSKYPGTKIAAISDIWYAYHSLAGRWPWAVEDALQKYGDVVRIAPNELVFVTPQALADIYSTHTKGLELFAKTQINNHGNDEHGGIIWEWDPVRHRQVARQLAPAFSGRALEAKEPTLHKYIDLFVGRMKSLGNTVDGVSLPSWVNWVCVDISADTAYNREMHAVRDMKDTPYLSILAAFNKAVVVIQTSWRFPFLSPLKYMFLLLTSMQPHSTIRDHSKQLLDRRIRRKGATEHLDFFEQMIPANREPPEDPKARRHLEQIAGQLLIAGYELPAMWFYYTIYHLLNNPSALKTLSVWGGPAAELPYLTACLRESIRVMPNVLTGMPVVSPGAMVDGEFIPRGVTRSPRNFYDRLNFHPERWLPADHQLYDPKFASDNRKGFQPFGQGPRMCAGKEIAWWQSRVFIAKVIWAFDLELVPGQDINMDRDLKGWGMYQKPEVRVKFVPVVRKGDS
ncbi:cytochrome P450 [Hypoxylon sp. FL1284]|nr:cytochrome P450 [Hypoxylon sp. FL1284]